MCIILWQSLAFRSEIRLKRYLERTSARYVNVKNERGNIKYRKPECILLHHEEKVRLHLAPDAEAFHFRLSRQNLLYNELKQTRTFINISSRKYGRLENLCLYG